MTPIKAACEILVVPVPGGTDANTFDIEFGHLYYTIDNTALNKRDELCEVELPNGSYQLVGKVGEITEEQALPLVHAMAIDEFLILFKDYQDDANGYFHYTALDSLASLLKANGIEGENYVILKKV